MYELQGHRDNARSLVELVAKLAPQQSREGYGTTPWKETVALFQPVLADVFPGEWTYAICSVVWQNGTIPPHRDGDASNSQSRRLHLVLQSNADAWVMHGGHWQQLAEGGIYTMDPLQIHAAVNWGSEPRVHLVVDVRNHGRSPGCG